MLLLDKSQIVDWKNNAPGWNKSQIISHANHNIPRETNQNLQSQCNPSLWNNKVDQAQSLILFLFLTNHD